MVRIVKEWDGLVKRYMQNKLMLNLSGTAVEAVLTTTLLSGQLYLWSPSQNPVNYITAYCCSGTVNANVDADAGCYLI